MAKYQKDEGMRMGGWVEHKKQDKGDGGGDGGGQKGSGRKRTWPGNREQRQQSQQKVFPARQRVANSLDSVTVQWSQLTRILYTTNFVVLCMRKFSNFN